MGVSIRFGHRAYPWEKITELRIDHIITHGYTAALHGTMAYGGKRRWFCDVYVFDGASKHAKIKEMITYAILCDRDEG
jgi:hypothetical protein